MGADALAGEPGPGVEACQGQRRRARCGRHDHGRARPVARVFPVQRRILVRGATVLRHDQARRAAGSRRRWSSRKPGGWSTRRIRGSRTGCAIRPGPWSPRSRRSCGICRRRAGRRPRCARMRSRCCAGTGSCGQPEWHGIRRPAPRPETSAAGSRSRSNPAARAVRAMRPIRASRPASPGAGAGVPNPVTGKAPPGRGYAPATAAQSESVLRGFYDLATAVTASPGAFPQLIRCRYLACSRAAPSRTGPGYRGRRRPGGGARWPRSRGRAGRPRPPRALGATASRSV